MPKTILALAAHPDDAEFFAGGTLAKLVAEGARVVIAIATDGRRGSFEQGGAALAQTRLAEAASAAAALGAEPPIFLGYPDLELDTLPPGLLREHFVRLIRRHTPDALFTHDPAARYEPHPDHRAVAWAASDAAAFAPLPLVHPEHLAEGLAPHFVAEKYFFSDYTEAANKVIDITGEMDRKLAALAEHHSQIKFLVEDVLRQAHMAGLDVRAMLGDALDDPLAAMAWAMRAQATEVGRRIGAAYGEAFRHARFHPFVETLFRDSSHPGDLW